jgi:tRNA-dihydrouridine synthase
MAGRRPPEAPEGGAPSELVCGQYEAMLRLYGRDLGVRVARKHLGWYLDRVPGAAEARARLMALTDPAKVPEILRQALERCGPPTEVAA